MTRIRWRASCHGRGVKTNSKTSEAGQGVCDGGIDGLHVPAESAGEKEEGGLEHHQMTP